MKGEIMFNNAHTIVISHYCIFTASNSPRLSVAFVFAAVAVFVPPRWIRGKHVRQRRGFTACTWFRSFERYCISITCLCTRLHSQSHHAFTNGHSIYWPIKSRTTILNFQLTKIITWLWRWLQHRLSKSQSPTTVLLRTPITLRVSR